jgi:hypothetical protein
LSRLVPPLAAVVAGVIVFHRALATWFSQDDFYGLARAAGLAPRIAGVWRWLSHQAFFDVLRPLAGLDPLPYHVAGLTAHAATAVLLAVLLARRVGPPAALVGAVFFAAHPALFTALYWIAAIGDVLALLFGLAALLLVTRRDATRWLALPAFALSLLAKESSLLLPLAALAFTPRRPRGRDPVVLSLAALAALHLGAFVAGNAFGVRDRSSAMTPYAIGWGANLWENALTYLGWTANFLVPTVRSFTDAVDRGVHPWGIALAALWFVGAAWRPLRERGWLMAGALWLLLIAPVLPLRNHTYHYYLYAPLAGMAWCVAALCDAALAERPAPRPAKRGGAPPGSRPAAAAWTIAGVLAALLTLNGYLLVAKIERAPFVLPELRADPTVDRGRIARRVMESLVAYGLPPGVTLHFWSPTAASLDPHGRALAAPAPRATYWEANVRDALLGGLAVRVMIPQVDRVTFVREFTPVSDRERYAVYLPDGMVRVVTSAEVDSILRAFAASDSLR